MVTRASLVSAVLVAIAACPSAAVTEPPRRLFVFGDSLAVGTKPYLPEELPDWLVRQDVDFSVKARRAPPALLAKGERLAPVVHLSLGTVDDPTRPHRYRRSVRRVMRVAGPERCVVWANIYRPMFRDHKTRVVNGWQPLNEVLSDEAGRRQNLVVVDWAAMVERHQDWLSTYDGTHVDERGYRARARAVARGVGECYERLRRRGTS